MDAPPVGPFGPRQAAERVVRPRRRLRSGLAQLLGIAVGVGLGWALPRIDSGLQVSSARTIEVCAAIGVSILGVTTLIFSLLFLVVQWAASTFSPRLSLLRTDPAVWRLFAFAVGLLTFTVTTTLAIGSRPKVSVAVPATALAATVIALGLMRNVQFKALRSILLAHVLATTAEQARGVLDMFYPPTDHPGDSGTRSARTVLPAVRSTVVWPKQTVALEQVDLRRLVATAGRADVTVVLRVRIGATLQRGDPVADVRGGELGSEQVTSAFVTGHEPTAHQDPLHSFRLLADIGLRALSPAVNDPATAVEVLDTMDGMLSRLATAQLDAASVPDEHGTVRVVLCLPSWTQFLRICLDDLCRAASNSPMVLLRARDLLNGLLATASPDRRSPVSARLQWVEQQLAERHPPFVRDPMP
ncbi:DUF2254 domain-containing protein [Streptomyces sp. NBC_01613]|uniref:DUF2254 family protein n=1 Tax=Streptomyces sp. NBC_01613 TaxID=2975896 RepID=UPI0038678756